MGKFDCFTVFSSSSAFTSYLSYFIVFLCMLCNQGHRLPRKDKIYIVNAPPARQNQYALRACQKRSCAARQIKKIIISQLANKHISI